MISKTNKPLYALALLALALAPAVARANLLDDEDQPKVEPKADDDDVPDHPDKPEKVEKADRSGKKAAPDKSGKKPKKADDDSASPPPSGHEHPISKSDAGPNTVVVPPKDGTGAKKKKKKPKAGDDQPQEPVHFDSKGLKGLREKGLVELTKDVVVTHGEMRLEADHAQVYFDEGQKDKKEKGLKRVVAEGNPVKIYGVDENSGDKFRGFGNQAIYLAKERTVILEGNARLWRGSDSVIRSKKITYEMDTGWIKADTVAGEVVPEQKGAPDKSGTSMAEPKTKPTPTPDPKDDEPDLNAPPATPVVPSAPPAPGGSKP